MHRYKSTNCQIYQCVHIVGLHVAATNSYCRTSRPLTFCHSNPYLGLGFVLSGSSEYVVEEVLCGW